MVNGEPSFHELAPWKMYHFVNVNKMGPVISQIVAVPYTVFGSVGF
jgi:hypothetical protein